MGYSPFFCWFLVLGYAMVYSGRNAMKRPEKEEVVARLTDKFRDADAVILTEYRGLSVPQVADLRNFLLSGEEHARPYCSRGGWH